jgi:6-phosphogluconolactonase
MNLTILKETGLENMVRAVASHVRPGRKIALSGGASYAGLFPRLAPFMKSPVPPAEFFPVDERLVPMDHPNSNWGMAKRLFFDAIGDMVSPKNFAASGPAYRALLKEKFHDGFPVFDTVFLGMGEDGHTASLFSAQDFTAGPQAVVLETRSPDHPHDRVTLSPVVLAAAKEAVFVVAGSRKKAILKRLVSGDDRLPATRVIAMRPHTVLIAEQELFKE